jgi:hypothetical protein
MKRLLFLKLRIFGITYSLKVLNCRDRRPDPRAGYLEVADLPAHHEEHRSIFLAIELGE